MLLSNYKEKHQNHGTGYFVSEDPIFKVLKILAAMIYLQKIRGQCESMIYSEKDNLCIGFYNIMALYFKREL